MRPIVLAVTLLCASCIPAIAQNIRQLLDDYHEPRPGWNRVYSVTYVVEGTAVAASLTYLNDRDELQQQKEIKIPWSASFSMKQGTGVFLRAEKQGSQGGDLTVHIHVDGDAYWHSEALGADTIATARGECCVRPSR